jgi:hypothetical protein
VAAVWRLLQLAVPAPDWGRLFLPGTLMQGMQLARSTVRSSDASRAADDQLTATTPHVSAGGIFSSWKPRSSIA